MNIYTETLEGKIIKELVKARKDKDECDCQADSEVEHVATHINVALLEARRVWKATRLLEDNQCPKCGGNLAEVESEPPFNPVTRHQLECEECDKNYVFYTRVVALEHREGTL